MLAARPLAAGPQPGGATVELTVPDYRVATIGGVDYVEIPGGEFLLLEQGRPKVPYFVQRFEYPAGYLIQDVVLQEQSEHKTVTGLKLPAVVLDTAAQSPRPLTPGRYPLKQFDWFTKSSPGGPTTLFIAVYPFQYEPETQTAWFCNRYRFEVRSVLSAVVLRAIFFERSEYEPGDTVRILVELTNSGPPATIQLVGSVQSRTVPPSVSTLPKIRVAGLGTDSTVALIWPTAGLAAGDYDIEVTARDENGTLLGRRQDLLSLGTAAVTIEGFTAVPQYFKLGDEIAFTLTYRNGGSKPLSGECALRIVDGTFTALDTAIPFTGLQPGAAEIGRFFWHTGPARKGAVYTATALVRGVGVAPAVRQLLLSTNRPPAARFTVTPESPSAGQEVSFDASGSTDADGTIARYEWRFGDGASTTGQQGQHHYQVPGTYEVILTVTDNEGGTGTAAQLVEVK